MLIINNELVSQLLTMDDCIRVQEEAFTKLPTGGAIHRPRIDMYFPCERAGRLFPLGHHGRRQRRLFRHPHEVRHHHLAEGRERQLDRGEILPRARHLLRPHLPGLDPQRRAARLHQRRRAAALPRRRRRRHRGEISRARGHPRRRHARLRRHGAHVPRRLQVRARHPAVQGLQPDAGAPRGLRRGDERGASTSRCARSTIRARRCAAPIFSRPAPTAWRRSTTPTGSSPACTSPISAAARCRTRAPTSSTSSSARARPACR